MDSDSSSPLIPIIFFVISFILFALASLAEICIASVRREKVQLLNTQGATGASALNHLYTLPMGPTGALLLLRSFSFTAGLLSAISLVTAQTNDTWPFVALGALVAMLLFGLAYGITRAASTAYGELIALRVALGVRVLAWFFNPVLAVASTISNQLLRVTSSDVNGNHETSSLEIAFPLEQDGEPLDEREVQMIRGVVQLDDTVAREIMVPRVDMIAAEIGTPLEELAELMVNKGHSRIPIYNESIDRIEGLAYARDILRHLAQSNYTPSMVVESIIRPALFIPESKTLEELLGEFQQERVHMAIVVDEHGGVSGLVTIEDLLEEIVGEILDEFDVGEPEVEVLSDSEYLIDARMSIDYINDLLSVSVENEGFDTLGGFVFQRLGKIPSVGDEVEYDGLRIEVISTVGRRLKRLRITRQVTQESPS